MRQLHKFLKRMQKKLQKHELVLPPVMQRAEAWCEERVAHLPPPKVRPKASPRANSNEVPSNDSAEEEDNEPPLDLTLLEEVNVKDAWFAKALEPIDPYVSKILYHLVKLKQEIGPEAYIALSSTKAVELVLARAQLQVRDAAAIVTEEKIQPPKDLKVGQWTSQLQVECCGSELQIISPIDDQQHHVLRLSDRNLSLGRAWVWAETVLAYYYLYQKHFPKALQVDFDQLIHEVNSTVKAEERERVLDEFIAFHKVSSAGDRPKIMQIRHMLLNLNQRLGKLWRVERWWGS
jgi:ParB-like chromosome segregation protein Spo0J